MHREMSSIPAMFKLLLITVLGGCAAVDPGPATVQVLPPDPGPLCADSRTDPKGPDECYRRLHAYLRRSIAATVFIGQFAYSEAEGSSGQSGTGAVVSPDGHVLTAYHVVKDAEYILATIRYAHLGGGLRVLPLRTVPMEIVRFDAARDVALLRPRHPTAFPSYLVPDTERRPRPNELLWHFGQASVGLRGSVKDYPVEEPQLKQNGLATMNVACRSGDSGGPVVSLDGRLIGLVLASVKDEDLTYFLPIGEAAHLLPAPPAEDGTPAGPTPATGGK